MTGTKGGAVLLSRRAFLVAGTSALFTAVRPARSSEPLPVAVHLPFGPKSAVATAVELAREAAAVRIGAPVTAVYLERPHPMRQALAALVGPAGARVPLLATDVLAHVTWEKQEGVPHGLPTLSTLNPVCKLTTGYSTTLFVPHDSPVRDWEDFVRLATSEPVTVADANAPSVHLRFLRLGLGAAVAWRRVWSGTEVFAAVRRPGIHAGLIDTLTLIAFDRVNPGRLRPLLTFGGERNADLGVPTLREVSGDRRLATTNSVALLGPVGLDAGQVARLHSAFAEAAADPATRAAAAERGFPLDVEGPEVVRETIERDRKVVETSGL